MPRVARLVVRQNGKERAFLKIDEGSGGKLTLTSDVANPAYSPEPVDVYWRDKISVHLSKKSEGLFRSLHATQHILGKRQDVHARLPIVKNRYFIYPVFSRIINELDHSSYDLSIKSKSELIRLAGYEINSTTIIMCCLITETGVRLPDVPGFYKAVVRFTIFNLVFYYAYLGVKTPKLPVQMNITTAPVSIDGVPDTGSFVELHPMVPENVPYYVLQETHSLTDLLVESAEKYHHANNTPSPYQPKEQWRWLSIPTPFDELDLNYGINPPHILKNASTFMENYARRLAYVDTTESGSAQEHLEYIENAICFGGLIDRADIDLVVGGDLLGFLEAAIRTSRKPT